MKMQPPAWGAVLSRRARGEKIKGKGAKGKESQGFLFTKKKNPKTEPFLVAITSLPSPPCRPSRGRAVPDSK